MKPVYLRVGLVGTALLLGLAAATTLHAQSAPTRPSTAERLARQRQATSASRALFAAKDFAGAESALEQASDHKRGTAELDFDTASGLARMAADFSVRRDTTTASAIARRALVRLASARARLDKTADPAQVANLMEMAGFISERYLGDLPAARLYYANAVQLSSETGQAAEALARLVATEVEVAKKTPARGRN